MALGDLAGKANPTRGAVKRGDRDILRLLGYGGKVKVSLQAVTFTPSRVRIGGREVVALRPERGAAPQRHELDLRPPDRCRASPVPASAS